MTRFELLKSVEDTLVTALMQAENLTVERIVEAVNGPLPDMLCGMKNQPPLDANERDAVRKGMEARLIHVRTILPTVVERGDHTPWLKTAVEEGRVKYRFWEAYANYLQNVSGLDRDTVDSIAGVTDKIADLLGDPTRPEAYSRRGMVVGHVQSGKTANYVGVLNKAVDCGYKMIVVLAGLTDSLRAQTQQRIDEGLSGKSIVQTPQGGYERTDVGVGLMRGQMDFSIMGLTTTDGDFSKQQATRLMLNLGLQDSTVYIAVIKKNPNSLANLSQWLDGNMTQKPFLLLDDEADNGSVNYRDPATGQTTTINKYIRELLNKFSKSVYLGYTATPFANIFIDPDASTAAHGDDIYPRDFIVALDASDRYVGPTRLFGPEVEDRDDIVRVFSDHTKIFPVSHKKDFPLQDIPDSMKESILVFMLVTTIRALKGQGEAHCSQLIKASRFTVKHGEIRQFVEREFNAALNAARVHGADGSQSDILNHMKELFDDEYSGCGFTWETVRKSLYEHCSRVEVVEVNSANHAADFTYSRKMYPHGRKVIVIGGLSLSRGLTLEGLCVSYMLRNTRLYDTLMQMGRFFGYRNGYDNLCRIYMTAQEVTWYRHVTTALIELFDEFKQMEQANKTPDDFGFRVRTSPLGLLITAKNKMRAATQQRVSIDLTGRLIETVFLPTAHLEGNWRQLQDFVSRLGRPDGNPAPENGFYWSGVPIGDVCDYITNFARSDDNLETSAAPVCDYLNQHPWDPQETKVDDFLFSKERGNDVVPLSVEGYEIVQEHRTIDVTDPDVVALNKHHRVGSPKQERAGLSEVMSSAEYQDAEKAYLKARRIIPGSFYRQFRKRPLLMLHVIDGTSDEVQSPIYSKLVAWSLALPYKTDPTIQVRTVDYYITVRELERIRSHGEDEEDGAIS